MFLIIKQSDNTIIGYGVKAIDENEHSKKGCLVFEIEDSEFDVSMIGCKLESFQYKD